MSPPQKAEWPTTGTPESELLFHRLELSRRAVMTASTAMTVVMAAGLTSGAAETQNAAEDGLVVRQPALLSVNGQRHTITIDPRVTLLDALREHLRLTGSKKRCDHGQCGACTVLVNGRRINACLSLAIMHEGDEITTIEGLTQGNDLHPMQAAFIARDGYQCGYCTPGQIVSAVGMLAEVEAGWPSVVSKDLSVAPELSGEEIRERMSGNICRCAAYVNIVAAIQDVSKGQRT